MEKRETVLTSHNVFHLQKAFQPNYILTTPGEMICNYYLCCTMEEVTGQQLTPEGSRFSRCCSDHIPFLFLPHTLSLNSPECTDFACSAGALWSSSLGSSRFLCPCYCFRMIETFTSFPFIKSSIIWWITAHLLCVYRKKEYLSKMNSQTGECWSSPSVRMKISNKLHAPHQPHWDHLGLWEASPLPLQKAQKLFFCYWSETHNLFFSFLSKHLFLNNCFSYTP